MNVIGSSVKKAPQKMNTRMSNRSSVALFDENNAANGSQ